MPLTTPSLNNSSLLLFPLFSLSLSFLCLGQSVLLFLPLFCYCLLVRPFSISPPLFQSEVMSLSTCDDLSSRWMLGGVLLLRLAECERKKEHKRRREWVEDENCTRTHSFACAFGSHEPFSFSFHYFIITIINLLLLLLLITNAMTFWDLTDSLLFL